MAKKIMIVGYDPGLGEVLADILATEGFEPVVAERVGEAERLAREQEISAVLADLEGPLHRSQGDAPLRRIREAAPNAPIVLCTTLPPSANGHGAATPCGVAAVMGMPFEIDELIEVLSRIIR